MNQRQALLELIEDSPYKFLNYQEPKKLSEMKKIQNNALNATFRSVYQQFLEVFASQDSAMLQ
jgi:hypothetical protein